LPFLLGCIKNLPLADVSIAFIPMGDELHRA
jgi:hypothetical protein